MKARGIFAIIAARLAALVGWARPALSREIPHKPVQRTHARTRKPRGGTGAAGAKLWHRLSAGHSSSAGWPGRRARQYAARGYGYIAPEPKKATA